jgi:transposase
MDRASLEQLLSRGLSLAEIGRRLDLHEATVSYWVGKHRLAAANRERHAARGGIARGELEPLVEAGLSIAQIAAKVDRSKATVRHWLKEHGLRTHRAERRGISVDGAQRRLLRCPRHGSVEFALRSTGGYRCTKCRAEAVSRRRRRVKRLLVAEAGGRCNLCGYDRCVAALEFHHVVPAEKRFALSQRGLARSLDKARAEAAKCVLLCANCHAEVEAGMVAFADGDIPRTMTVACPDPIPG